MPYWADMRLWCTQPNKQTACGPRSIYCDYALWVISRLLVTIGCAYFLGGRSQSQYKQDPDALLLFSACASAQGLVTSDPLCRHALWLMYLLHVLPGNLGVLKGSELPCVSVRIRGARRKWHIYTRIRLNTLWDSLSDPGQRHRSIRSHSTSVDTQIERRGGRSCSLICPSSPRTPLPCALKHVFLDIFL